MGFLARKWFPVAIYSVLLVFDAALAGVPYPRDRRASNLWLREAPDPYNHTDIKVWAALGDSYASGIGSGDKVGGAGDYFCSRYDNSYPYIILNDPSMGDTDPSRLQYFACSGHTSVDILNKQVGSIDKPQMITLSAGGNDVGLSDILNQCVFQWSGEGNKCDSTLDDSQHKIDSSEFADNLDKMLDGIKGKLADDGTIYYVGYAKFWGTGDNICDGVTWSCFSKVPWIAEYLLQSRRIRMNSMVEDVNTKIQDAIKRANWKGGGDVVYVDWDTQISSSNGRFCEIAVDETNQKEAGNREGLVFFEWYTNADDIPDDPKDELIFIKDGDNGKDGTFEGTIKSLMLQTLKDNPDANFNYDTQGDVNIESGLLLPDGYGRIFHPRPLGHQIIAEKVMSAMDLRKAQKNGQSTLPTTTVGCAKYAAATLGPGSNPTPSCGPPDPENRVTDPGALKVLASDFCSGVDFTKDSKKTTAKNSLGISINFAYSAGTNCNAPSKDDCIKNYGSVIQSCQYDSHTYNKEGSFDTTCGGFSLSINFPDSSEGSSGMSTDQGILNCNPGAPAGPDDYMSLNEVDHAIEVFCSDLRTSKTVFKTGGVPIKSDQILGNHPVSISATWNNAANCPVLDFGANGDAAYRTCKDRLNIPVQNCDTVDNNPKPDSNDFWKAGGKFFRDCISWKIGRH